MRFPIASQVALFIFRANEKYVLHFVNVSLGIEVDGSCPFSSILPGTTNVSSLTPKLCFIYGKKELEVAKKLNCWTRENWQAKLGQQLDGVKQWQIVQLNINYSHINVTQGVFLAESHTTTSMFYTMHAARLHDKILWQASPLRSLSSNLRYRHQTYLINFWRKWIGMDLENGYRKNINFQGWNIQ